MFDFCHVLTGFSHRVEAGAPRQFLAPGTLLGSAISASNLCLRMDKLVMQHRRMFC
jgi:hypothetical protein